MHQVTFRFVYNSSISHFWQNPLKPDHKGIPPSLTHGPAHLADYSGHPHSSHSDGVFLPRGSHILVDHINYRSHSRLLLKTSVFDINYWFIRTSSILIVYQFIIILHRNPSNSPDASSLANTFLDFFKDEIDRIPTKSSPSHSLDLLLFPPAPPPKMINFIPAALTEIYKLISASERKQCLLDSILTFLLKLCFNELGPIIKILSISLSLSEGIFPSSFEQALVQPLLKKPSLSTDDLNNFRPISNLIFISKILEKVVASRIQSHLSSNSLSSSLQSAYRTFYSTETALLKIHNDLILAMDLGEVTSLILLDFSVAFDTVDHSILLTRLQNCFGLNGLSLYWFSSYLSLRTQAVSINDSISAFSILSCGVPQGSVLGPLLFTLYTTPLGSVISKNYLKYHMYADDTQLYISFTPTNSVLSLETRANTFNDILSWMNLNKLLLNPSKTEFLQNNSVSNFLI